MISNIDVSRRMAEAIMAEQISKMLYMDFDPEATAWWSAIHYVWKHQRKSKRHFLKLWMDDTQAHRGPEQVCSGLAQLVQASSTYGSQLSQEGTKS
jgi:hypothetical protein